MPCSVSPTAIARCAERYQLSLCPAFMVAALLIGVPSVFVGCEGVPLFDGSTVSAAHAANAEELSRREVYRRLLRDAIFSRAVIIRCTDGARSYEEVML